MTDKPLDELIKALALALPDVESASKDKANPQFKGSKYADLTSVIAAIRPVIQHGLWFRQSPIEHHNGACIETFYVHSSGQQMSAGVCFVPASKNDAQGFGSAMTYCRRYGLLAAFGIAPDDDDGNAATNSAANKTAFAGINDNQRDELIGMIEGYGFNVQKICEFYKIKALTEIPAEEFENVKTYLNKQFDKKREKENTNA
jgi:ERF superfamily